MHDETHGARLLRPERPPQTQEVSSQKRRNISVQRYPSCPVSLGRRLYRIAGALGVQRDGEEEEEEDREEEESKRLKEKLKGGNE